MNNDISNSESYRCAIIQMHILPCEDLFPLLFVAKN